MVTFAEIMDLWPSRKAFAEDIGAKQAAVTNMAARNSVPAKYWYAIIEAANRRCIPGVNLATLAAAARKVPA
jgi:hypothetical protein